MTRGYRSSRGLSSKNKVGQTCTADQIRYLSSERTFRSSVSVTQAECVSRSFYFVERQLKIRRATVEGASGVHGRPAPEFLDMPDSHRPPGRCMAVNPDSSASRPTIGDHVPLRGGSYSRPYPFLEDQLNESTFKLLRSSLRGLKRVRLLRLGTRLYCHECRVMRTVRDYFASGEAVLDCQHRRPAFFLDEGVARDFQSEIEQRKIRKEILGYAAPTAGGRIHRYEENVEAA
jgi:hypothetical protein